MSNIKHYNIYHTQRQSHRKDSVDVINATKFSKYYTRIIHTRALTAISLRRIVGAKVVSVLSYRVAAGQHFTIDLQQAQRHT
jgi:hypothetical protein